MPGQSQFGMGKMSPMGGINSQPAQPNPLSSIQQPQHGLATAQGVQQAIKTARTARLSTLELLRAALFGTTKSVETSSTGGSARSSDTSGSTNKGSGAHSGAGFGVHSIGGAGNAPGAANGQ